MNKIKFLCVFLMSISGLAYGQGQLSGLVSDSASKPLEGAVVSLLLAEDSSLVKTAITEADGKYLFQGLKPANYFVMVTEFDHEKYKSAPVGLTENQKLVLPEISLTTKKADKLEEVVIAAKIPLIERKMDRTVVNVDAMISAAGNNALELLEKSPGVLVDQNGGILLQGKSGVMVLIDDKQTYLSGEALLNYLKSLPASAISQIEIMTNPPAKYDAAGNVGIINFVTKKSKLRGTNGSVTLNYGQGIYSRTFNNFTLNHRNNKFNFFANGSGFNYIGYSNLFINRTYRNEDLSVQSAFDQQMVMKNKSYGGNLRAGFDYYLSEKTTLGVSLNGAYSNSKGHTNNISELRNPDQSLTKTVIAANTDDQVFKNGGLNLNFRKQFDSTGRSLTMDLDYVYYENIGEESYLNKSYTPNGTLFETDLLTGRLPSKISIYAYKLDYSHPFKKAMKLEAGFKSSYAGTDNLVEYYNTIEGVVSMDYDKTNHFRYDEFINAGYVNLSKEYKRFGFQAGLRAEHTTSRGNQLGNPMKPSSRFNRDYMNLFPTVYASYKIDSMANNQLVFSYGKRVDRPYYENLNPFLKPLDKFTFYTGNPYLRPTFSHNLSFTYSFKSFFSADIRYSRTKNEISETIRIDENNIYYSQPQNIGKSQALTLALNTTIPVGKWLTSSLYTEISNTRYQSILYTEQLNSSGNFFYASLTNNFKFNKGWSGELSAFYVSKMTYAQFTLGARGRVNVAVQKKIMKDKASLKLSFNDIFYTMASSGVINNLRLTDATYINYPDSRNVFLTFTYGFGKPMESKPKHQGSGSESEQQRVKQ